MFHSVSYNAFVQDILQLLGVVKFEIMFIQVGMWIWLHWQIPQ